MFNLIPLSTYTICGVRMPKVTIFFFVYRPDTGQDQQDQGADQGRAELQGGERRRVPQVQGLEYLRYRLVQRPIVQTAMVRYPYSTGTVVR
jgi:hypothetical protein